MCSDISSSSPRQNQFTPAGHPHTLSLTQNNVHFTAFSFHRDRLVSYFPFVLVSLDHLLSLRPTSSNGDRIEPNSIRVWLRRHGLHWSCFCPLKTGEPMSCQIVHGMNEHVSAYCGQFISHCGFCSKFECFFILYLCYSFFPSGSFSDSS